jgi:hypothetical protein
MGFIVMCRMQFRRFRRRLPTTADITTHPPLQSAKTDGAREVSRNTFFHGRSSSFGARQQTSTHRDTITNIECDEKGTNLGTDGICWVRANAYYQVLAGSTIEGCGQHSWRKAMTQHHTHHLPPSLVMAESENHSRAQ